MGDFSGDKEFQIYTPAEAYREFGLDKVPVDPVGLYLDMVKRAVINIFYEDTAIWKFSNGQKPQILNRFDLKARFWGEDLPTAAHTMIGWRRLSNVQRCAESIFKNSIAGDFVETGVMRGGSTIFMRALLKAFGSDRKVYACDTFVFEPPRQDIFSRFFMFMIAHFLKLAIRIPSRAWKLTLYRMIEKQQKNFPISKNPSAEWINCFLYAVSNLDVMNSLFKQDQTSLSAVQSHFARYGLLDSQVVFLKGFFADTLPKSNIEAIALLRCDGDTFESTYGVLQELYAKVSPGGFVIIDDYNSFSDCKDAVDKFRKENKIGAPLIPIDHLSIYWQKPSLNISVDQGLRI